MTSEIFSGDPIDASFADGSFDVVTSFHVVEHLPRPLAALARMIRWLAQDGLLIVEVRNAGGAGGRLTTASGTNMRCLSQTQPRRSAPREPSRIA